MRPVHVTDQTMAEAPLDANIISTLPNLLEAQLTEITQAVNTQHDNHVPGELFCFVTLYPDAHDTSIMGQDPFYAYKASIDPDTLYLHEAMKAKDWHNFRIAMQKEIDDRMEGKNFSVIH